MQTPFIQVPLIVRPHPSGGVVEIPCSFAVVGLGAAPGEPDSERARLARALRASRILRSEYPRTHYSAAEGRYKGAPEPALVLWGTDHAGAARALGSRLRQESILIVVGDAVGHLHYMDGARAVSLLGPVVPGPSPLDGDYTESDATGIWHIPC